MDFHKRVMCSATNNVTKFPDLMLLLLSEYIRKDG